MTAAFSAAGPPLRQPDLFDRAVWLVQEIGAAIDKLGVSGPNLVARIRVARTARDIVALETANAELLVLLNASVILTDTLAKQIERLKFPMREMMP